MLRTKSIRRVVPGLTALGLVLLFSSSVWANPSEPQAAKRKFDPFKHFPQECYFYAETDIGRLYRGLGETPIGSLLSHPRVLKAAGQLPQIIKQGILSEMVASGFEREFGVSLDQFISSFTGRVSMTSPTIDAKDGPTLLMSFEVGSKKKQLAEVFLKMATVEGRGTPPHERSHGGVKIYQWVMRWGPGFAHAFVGDSLILSLNGGPLEPVIDRYRGNATRRGLASNTRFAKARERSKAGSGKPLLLGYVDLRAFREKLYELFETPEFSNREQAEVKRIFKALGFDECETVTAQIGLRGGDLEGKFFIDSPNGNSGAIKAVAELFRGPADYAAFSKIPASSSIVKAGSLRLGTTVRDTIRLFREAFTGSIGNDLQEVNQVIEFIEKQSGLSAKADVYPLGRLDLFSFVVTPPAGSWIPDGLVLCRTNQLKPYLNVAKKVARKYQSAEKPVESMGVSMRNLRFAGLFESLGNNQPQPIDEPLDFDRALGFAFRNPTLGLYWKELEDGWTILGFTPHSVGRYVKYYAKAPMVSEDEKLMELVQGRIVRGSSFMLARGGRSVVSAYNTATSMLQRLTPTFANEFKSIGFDPALLPAGEIFADKFRDGFLAVRGTKTTLQYHGHRFVSNIASSFVVPLLPLVLLARREAVAVAEMRRMRARELAHGHHAHDHEHEGGAAAPADAEARRLIEIGALFDKFMKKTKSRAYPNDPRGGVHAFQKLADAGVLPDPGKLVHPFSSDRPAGKTAAGKVKIEERNCSYHVVPWKQGPHDIKTRILCYEKQAFKRGGRYVMYVDRRVEFLEEAKFKALLEKQTKRYGKKRGE